MRESIYIRSFGPVKEIEIDDIRPFTVFIGKSGIGKSTVVKTVALFRWIFKKVSLREYLKSAGIESLFKFDFREYLKNGGMEEYVKPDTHLIYSFGNCRIEYSKERGLNIISPPDFESLSLEKGCFITDKRNMIPDIASGEISLTLANYYLREGKKDFELAVDKIPHMEIDFLNVSFDTNKRASKSRRFRIKGRNEDDSEYNIRLQDASSGTQTVTPLSLIVEYFSKHYDLVKAFNQSVFSYLADSDKLASFSASSNVGDIRNRRVNIHIEEPELSLFPESQCALIDFLVGAFNVDNRPYDMTYMITTHSPYIINYLNLLSKRAEKGIVGKASLSFENMAVYEIVEGYLNDLSVDGMNIFNTTVLSEPIDTIYSEFNNI